MSRLTSPLALRCGLELPARIAMAPLTNCQSDSDGTLSETERRWLVRRASDGFGVVSTCAAFVSAEGHAWDGQLGISDDRHIPGLRQLAGDIAAAGAVGIVQLHHGGQEAKMAPGPMLSTADDPEQNIHGATAADIARVIADFVAAALRAEAAGFQGVEVHGANGYLFTQFLAPADNPRNDGYGGDLVGRARLLRETVRAVRAAVKPGFAVGVRLSPVDLWAQRGLRLEDSVQVGRWMAEDGVDFVHLSLRDATGVAPHEPDLGPVARAFRDALPADVALFVVGGVWTLADAQAAEAAGADVVVVGKASIAHPDLPMAMQNPDFVPLRPPWTPEHLVASDVGPALLGYLSQFPGMVVGGTPPRG